MLCLGVDTAVAVSTILWAGTGPAPPRITVEGDTGTVMVRVASVGRDMVKAFEAVSAYGER